MTGNSRLTGVTRENASGSSIATPRALKAIVTRYGIGLTD